MRSSDWEIKLARRLGWITLAGGIASWTIRQVRLGGPQQALVGGFLTQAAGDSQ